MHNAKPVSVGALCDLGFVELQTGPFGTQLHAHEYVSDGIPVVPTEAIRDRQINYEVLPHISAAKAKALNRHRLREGDILFARRGVQATGHTAYVRPREAGFVCGTGAIRLRVIKPNEMVHSEYLSHVFANPVSIEWFKFHAIGATMPNLNEGIIRSFPLSLPPIKTQHRVAALLSTFDDKIELNRRMNETLEEMARAIFKDWFVDFGPTRRKQDGATDPVTILGGLLPDPAKAEPVAALFPDRFGDDGLPEGWEEREVGELCPVAGGGTPSTKEPNFWDGGTHLWATPKDLSKLTGLFLRETERRITDAGLAKVSSGLSPTGSVLLSSRAPIGYVAIAEEPLAVNQGFIVMQPTPLFPTEFAYFWTLENLEHIKANANGSTFQEISKKNFRPLKVCHSGEELLTRFCEIAGPFLAMIRNNERESQTLAATRDLLLPKLMSGEIRLKEAGGAL
ncbi:restriction endonuclease subunit S [Hoeflea alexandrii]